MHVVAGIRGIKRFSVPRFLTNNAFNLSNPPQEALPSPLYTLRNQTCNTSAKKLTPCQGMTFNSKTEEILRKQTQLKSPNLTSFSPTHALKNGRHGGLISVSVPVIGYHSKAALQPNFLTGSGENLSRSCCKVPCLSRFSN